MDHDQAVLAAGSGLAGLTERVRSLKDAPAADLALQNGWL